MEYSGWYPDHQLRLFRKGKGLFVGARVWGKYTEI